MTVYRFSHEKFADDLTGTGAALKGGRWNMVGLNALYTSERISLGLLEVLVNANTLEDLKMIHLMQITIPDSETILEISSDQLKKNWIKDVEYSQWLGSDLLSENKYLVLKVPSVIIEDEWNYVLNTKHKNYSKIKLIKSDKFDFDERLFKTK